MKTPPFVKKLTGPIAIIIAILLVVLMFIFPSGGNTDIESADDYYEGVGEPSQTSEREPIFVNSTLVMRAQYPARVNAQGFVTPRWQSDMKSMVNGEVVFVSDRFAKGGRFLKGELLARIDDTDYRAALANAKVIESRAQLHLQQEQQQSRRALEDWKISGFSGDPDSLTLRKPQLAVAKMSLAAAKASYQSALKNVQNTQLIAPYDAAVRSRSVSLGDYIQEGDKVASLFATHVLHVNLNVSQQQLFQLNLSIGDLVELVSSQPQSAQKWRSRVTQISPEISANERSQNIQVELMHSEHEMPLVGEFVRAGLVGQVQTGLLPIAESNLSKSSHVWYIDEDSRLQSFLANVAFYDDGFAYVKAPPGVKRIEIVVAPSNQLLSGVKVIAQLQPSMIPPSRDACVSSDGAPQPVFGKACVVNSLESAGGGES